MAPMATQSRPTKRSWPSESSVRRRNASRQACGARSGRSPSSTSTSAQAARKDCGTISSLANRWWTLRGPRLLCISPRWPGLLRARPRRALAAAGLPQVLEELGARIEHHDVAPAPERGLVGLEAPVERVELGILSIGGRVDCRGFRVPVALGLLSLLVGVGQDDLALPVGVGADLLRFGRAHGAQLVGDPLALRFHALIDLRQDFFGQLDAAQPHVDDLDADLLRIGVGALPGRLHDLVALG